MLPGRPDTKPPDDIVHVPYDGGAQNRAYLDKQLNGRPAAKRENHLAELSKEERRDGASDHVAAAAGERGSAYRDGGNRRQEIVVAGGL